MWTLSPLFVAATPLTGYGTGSVPKGASPMPPETYSALLPLTGSQASPWYALGIGMACLNTGVPVRYVVEENILVGKERVKERKCFVKDAVVPAC